MGRDQDIIWNYFFQKQDAYIWGGFCGNALKFSELYSKTNSYFVKKRIHFKTNGFQTVRRPLIQVKQVKATPTSTRNNMARLEVIGSKWRWKNHKHTKYISK